MSKSILEEQLLNQMRGAGLPEPWRELQALKPRRWKIDFAYPDHGKLAIEVEGGTWGKGASRHTTGSGFRSDCEKYRELALAGWVVLRFTADEVRDRSALATIERALTLLRSAR